MRRHILGHHRTGADEGVLANRVAANNRRVGTDRGATLDQCAAHFFHPTDVRTRIMDIGKDHAGPAEYIVLQGHPIVDGDIVLDLASVTNGYPRTNDDILTDVAIASDF